MKLRLHFLNVDHGDAIILEQVTDSGHHFAIIDSNNRGTETPPVITKLRELGAQRLSFVMLTHPHQDHYRGLGKVLEEFQGKIGQFFIFPLGDFVPQRIKILSERYLELAKATDDKEIQKTTLEFVRILKLMFENMREQVSQFSGEQSILLPPEGFDGIEMYSILPPSRAKGYYFEQIAKGDSKIVGDMRHNNLSLAVLIRFAGVELVLGGDGTYENWMYHRKRNRHSDDVINARVVKIPHHGSEHDAAPDVLDYLYAKAGERIAIISANGQSHPSQSVIDDLEQRGIKPYCTNLIPKCGARVRQLVSVPGVDPALGKFINYLAADPTVVQPCQGDVTVTVDDTGAVSVKRQYAHPCGFRGELDALAS